MYLSFCGVFYVYIAVLQPSDNAAFLELTKTTCYQKEKKNNQIKPQIKKKKKKKGNPRQVKNFRHLKIDKDDSKELIWAALKRLSARFRAPVGGSRKTRMESTKLVAPC